MTSGARLPTWKERENNKKRERRRRAIASKIFSGLRQFGNYKLPKHCDNNEVLKALCAEAGWVVEEDGTTYRKGAKPVERMEVCASAPASPSPTSSFHATGNTHTITPSATDQQATTSGASLIPWLKGLSGTTTPTSCFHAGTSSAPVTPPLSSPRGNKSIINNNNNNLGPNLSRQQSDWDRIAMAEHWLETSTAGYANNVGSGNWSPVIVGPAIPSPARAPVVRPCETPDGCLTPCSDVGDSEPSVTELLSRYSGNKSGRWINGMRVVVNHPVNNANGGSNREQIILNGFGNMISSSGTATPTTGRMHHFVDNSTPWINTKPVGFTANPHLNGAANHHHSTVNGGGVEDNDSPCSSSVCGVVLEKNSGKKRNIRDFDLEMSSSISRLEVMGTHDGANDRLKLTLATPASSP